MMRLVLVALVLALACGRGSSARTRGGVYVSLGDSIAAGVGASDRERAGFAAVLAEREGASDVENVAAAGATTQDVLDKQVPAATDVAANRRVAFITISAGGNDLAALVPNASCQEDPLPDTCPLDAALAGVEARLDEILRRLRAAEPRAPIVLLAYPNFFSGTGHEFEGPAGRVLRRLDAVIVRVAARYPRTGVAVTAGRWEGNGGTLTHVGSGDFGHPTDAGNRIIADAFGAALASID